MRTIAFLIAGLALAAAPQPLQADGGASSLMKVKIPAALIARNRPAGSGFYVVSLDATECKAEVAEAYGCKFDAKGNPTTCGVAEVDDKNDDVIIATASK